MEITDIRVRVANRDEKMRGVVSITFDDCFVVHDIKVIEGNDALFIAMPSRRTTDGEYRDIAHPINAETRGFLQKLILDAYEEALNNEPKQAAQ